jgi:hypothetical protein
MSSTLTVRITRSAATFATPKFGQWCLRHANIMVYAEAAMTILNRSNVRRVRLILKVW